MNRQIKKRMFETDLTLLNASGTPLKNQQVNLRQTNHKFLFGTAAFDLVPLANGEYSGKALQQAEDRAEQTLEVFNTATLPFYWIGFEAQRGNPRTEALQKAAEWCANHHLTTKGHPLCWHTLAPDWLLPMTNAEIIQAQTGRIRREVSDFRGLINMWDAINEAVIMPIFDRYDNGLTRICREMGRIKTIKLMFETARAENPDAVFLINDFETSPAYDILVEGCLEAGIKIDAIGIQSHMHQGYWGVEKTQEILERFSRFNLPIHFTENSLVSGHLMPPEIVDLNDYQVEDWPSTADGEERQAREVVQHYETLFAHPLVQSIIWWDLFDGHWLNAPSGLIRKDGSPKPGYDELKKLVKGEWWLSPTVMSTDDSGRIRVNGFPGEYEVSVNGETRQIYLDQALKTAQIRF